MKIGEPFYVGSTEATFGQYRLFDPDHESGFIEERDKDRSRRGVLDMSQGDLPVVRITQQWVAKAESFTPNAWGLCNVLGNVSEWTATDYRPLEGVGVTSETAGKVRYKTVRGGSWNDIAAFATLASRWRYTACQPVYDVAFRVVARP